ncbi:hypothetical protein GUITHDRAFT_133596 [Guillardia theta CCMP2712]|uniref:Folate receptor-like domain-containing protein n=1 Tax=Guillardia theta (strain CCMP2712) TaxID=905079 RepID=L1JW11_GUITC|nr:hypothetical protein GUITHDRAFT_133596 [Guillardia theta CCMP2712]EKX52519.1 hypothetical protein GUITHDRAFT_133596 [Guillardia theta CCMP2712]|eukprot:XP_005839499.1 hypothetical protein GUITHDRAFT_133596 [Guillardia theta CCMP2712]
MRIRLLLTCLTLLGGGGGGGGGGGIFVSGQWPICYDHAVPNGCMDRDANTGAELPGKVAVQGACYYSDPWTENSTFPWLGNQNDTTKTLPLCSNELRRAFDLRTSQVNTDCDYKSFLAVQRCGNCWVSICNFHNALTWKNAGGQYMCMMDLFIRRMECYSSWYSKYCGVKQDGSPFISADKNGLYDICSGGSRVSVSATLTFLFMILMVTRLQSL